MKYLQSIQEAYNAPLQLENLYQSARQANEFEEFKADIITNYNTSQDNVLYVAWYYRLQSVEAEPQKKVERSPNWWLAILLGIITGLTLWALSGPGLIFIDQIPYVVLLGAPITTLFALIFLTLTAKKNYRRGILVGLGLLISCLYIMVMASLQPDYYCKYYLELMAVQLVLLSWIAIGITVMGLRSGAENRFAFLIKSFEVMITAGLYLIAGMILGMITLGMFGALSITLPDELLRLMVAGGIGLISVVAIASVYDPTVSPESQDFNLGLSKFIFTMMRLLLPLTLAILVIYVLVIPFNFMEPFTNRDILIVYNVMLFAIMGLLIGVTPIKVDGLSSKIQVLLRNGILAVSVLAVLVSLYALSAVIYRTVQGGITINRLAIIGWNSINIALLVLLIFKQFKSGMTGWVDRLHSVFSLGAAVYLVWAVFLMLAIPILFR